MGFRIACVDRGVKYHMEVRKKWSEFGVVVGVVDRLEDQAR